MKSIIITIITIAVIAVQGEIKLTNDNGYTGITIVVENHQEQHDDFIPALKELLQNASNYLYNSTGKMAYFGDVTVVIPSHWNLNKTENVTFVDSPMPLTAGDIRIDFPNPKYNNEPYTLQPGACSEPGKYIHMTMDFIRNVNGTMQQDFGDDIDYIMFKSFRILILHFGYMKGEEEEENRKESRTLVHEWAHFRYGVFDEYGGVKNKQYKQFYLDGEDFHPVTCEENIPGFFEREDGEECLFEDYNNGCIFKPAESEVDITSSIMYLPYLNSINQFCDDTVENGHNYKAPSPQNYQCGYTPTWAVISAHNDFHPPTKKNFTETNLRIIQPHVFSEPRFVIVMDVSLSMGFTDSKTSVTRLEYLNIAVTRFLSSIAPDNSKVSLVEFSDWATILSDLRIINSTSRNQLISKLPKKPVHGTCIGCGLLKAIEVLSSNRQTAAGGTIILVTDGENTPSYKNIPDVMNDVLKSKVVVDTIAIGVKASANLHLLSKNTGGSSSYFSGQPKDLLKLDSAFIVSVHRQKDVETEGIQLFMKSILLPGHQKVSYVINVDPSLGNDTTFVISGVSAINWLDTYLISPLNKKYTESNDPVFKYDKIASTKTFKLPKADSGKWKLVLHNTNNIQDYANVIVTSKQKNKDSVPIAVRCWLNSTVVDLSKCTNVVVFCHVLKGYDAVIRATVNVTIQGTKTYTIRLYDDGSGADTEADDGIYTSYFTQFQADIRYSITGTVINDGKAQILKGTSASPAPRRYSGKGYGKPITKVPITSLKRAPHCKN
ncbi:Calcium-activated chloride channel regulator 1 [Nymphon striatum]|nr:Calcium-activated chloride channel regulator 1 [Nymphon striatum]